MLPGIQVSVKTISAVFALMMFGTFARAQNPIVLQDVRLIDGTLSPARDHMQITIEGGSIVEIRSALLRIAFPPNATILNLSGKTVMPGIINGHGHLGLVKGTAVSPDNYTRQNIEHQLAQYDRYGITTMISLGMNKDLLYQLRSAQEKDQFGGATILTADRGLGSPGCSPGGMRPRLRLARTNSIVRERRKRREEM
jgi:imidazolonepropionase-like amidohydrolase